MTQNIHSCLLPDSSPIASDLFIRAVCIFVSADDFAEPVKVCYTHCRDSSGNLKCEISEHLVRCSHSSSIYEMNQYSGRHSVITPFPEYNQQPGAEGGVCQLAYKFMVGINIFRHFETFVIELFFDFHRLLDKKS